MCNRQGPSKVRRLCVCDVRGDQQVPDVAICGLLGTGMVRKGKGWDGSLDQRLFWAWTGLAPLTAAGLEPRQVSLITLPQPFVNPADAFSVSALHRAGPSESV